MPDLQLVKDYIESIYSEKITLNEPFIDFASRFSSHPGTVVLMSGGDLDCARYHMIAAKPWLTFLGRGNRLRISIDNETYRFEGDPFETLRTLINRYKLDQTILPQDLFVPIACGLFGYLSYDLKDSLERLPRTSIDDLGLPHICLFSPSLIVIHDKIEEITYLCIPERQVLGRSTLDNDLKYFKTMVSTAPQENGSFSGGEEVFRSNFMKTDYMATIQKIKEYIASGHVYQVNMSQRFDMDFEGDSFSLFKALFKNNPAPFFAYIHAGDHQIVSTSPERFIQRIGERIETRPIKGTRPRGISDDEDKRLRLELLKSKKDDAELSMIVDLLRNDLGKVCVRGTVKVTEHKRLEAYQNVYHLISIVEGELSHESDSVDLLSATFPGGSITGCPKIRSMEIIDELEPTRRHIYTGSIGYISFHDTMDLSIAIRTATILNNKILFSVGGGIVFDSDPREEFEETLHKGQTMMEILHENRKRSNRKPSVWINGTLMSLEQAFVPITDLGFQYGYGFFETIRIDKGNPKYLDEHIQRFNDATEQLFFQDPPDLTWNEVIDQVISRNGLKNQIAAVKIIATKGDRETPPFNNIYIVTARPYVHRLKEKSELGLNIISYPEPRLTPLADHKTLNYLYYFLAGKWAAAKGADEALIMNPDETVSETNTGNIILINGKTITTPSSPHALPGIMENTVLKLLMEWGFKVNKRGIMKKDLFDADLVIITNSLMGAVPVLRIDNIKLKKPSDLWQKINENVL